MKKIICLCLCLFALGDHSNALAFSDLSAFEVSDDTPIIFSDKLNVRVLEDAGDQRDISRIIAASAAFKPPADIQKIKSSHRYWVAQKFSSRLSESITLRIDPSGWETIHSHVIHSDGRIESLKISGVFHAGHNRLAEINPFVSGSRKTESQFTRFTLHAGEEVQVLTELKANSNLPPRSFSLTFYDELKFSEVRRLGLYLEGGLLGILFALAVFGSFSAANNKDGASFAYSIWIVVAFCQILSNSMPEGPRLSEFVLDVEGINYGHQSIYWSLFVSFGYLQAICYAFFAAAFLNVREHFPIIHKAVYLYVAIYFCHYLFTSFVPHDIGVKILWLPLGMITLLLLVSFYTVAFIRYRQGLKIAKFFMYAIVPYLTFRSIFILGLAGVPSPFSLLEPSGFGLLMQNSNTAQAIGLCCEALIMALAVVSRTRWLQEQLAVNLKAQQELVEGQNRVLEATVAERTAELASQHKELDEAHQMLVGSVNYASRLQRGQLPRALRLKGRFASFDVIWEPRDTIGGDLWWVSSSKHGGPFVLAVADCTGHGVPGAMLSLLVSNSLERIYATDTNHDPIGALQLLDHYVRTGLNQDRPDSESDDGCDAAVLRIDPARRRLEYAGAKLELWQLKISGQVLRHPAARISLGYSQVLTEDDRPELQVITYDKDDTFVIVTDGFTDQIGGPDGRRVSYGYRRLQSLLTNMANASVTEISQAMKADFDAWQGKNLRRDDVTAIVFRL
jgi:serine phosphatase RsbU (regulator of sigma subunit)